MSVSKSCMDWYRKAWSMDEYEWDVVSLTHFVSKRAFVFIDETVVLFTSDDDLHTRTETGLDPQLSHCCPSDQSICSIIEETIQIARCLIVVPLFEHEDSRWNCFPTNSNTDRRWRSTREQCSIFFDKEKDRPVCSHSRAECFRRTVWDDWLEERSLDRDWNRPEHREGKERVRRRVFLDHWTTSVVRWGVVSVQSRSLPHSNACSASNDDGCDAVSSEKSVSLLSVASMKEKQTEILLAWLSDISFASSPVSPSRFLLRKAKKTTKHKT